jgi:protein phosphatase PTC7
MRLVATACQIPHPAKKATGGEDAYFMRYDSNTTVLGVADGVGGWASRGVDAGLYARELMSHCYDYFADHANNKSEEGMPSAMRPVESLEYAHAKTKILGSSTACVLLLDGQNSNDSNGNICQGGVLHAANVGDSGYIIIRNGKILFESTPQQHGFNFPFQLQYQGQDRWVLGELRKSLPHA